MKKIILLSSIICLSSFLTIDAKTDKSVVIIHKSLQEKTIKGYIFFKNSWHYGFVTLIRTDSGGYELESYHFNDLVEFNGQPLIGKPQQRVFPTSLNPNNPMAIQNNFTHYIDLISHRVYITL